jgi:predicted Fe-S protein YdhL (DUF1289 family)
MPLFPKVQSPCPYKDKFSSIVQGEFCSMCKRDVFDLNHMDDKQRVAFLKSCSGEVCVSYSLPVKRAAKAAAFAAAAVMAPTTLAAQDAPPAAQEPTAEEQAAYEADMEYDVFVGGIKPADALVEMDAADDAKLAELPIVYEEETETVSEKKEETAKPTS